MTARPDLTGYVAHFRSRVVQDALNEATSDYWIGRAKTFEEAAPRPGDFTGAATPADLDAQRQRLLETARACRNRAAVAQMQDGIDPDIEAVWNEAS